MDDQPNWTSLGRARPMDLDYTPATPAANTFGEAFGALLETCEPDRTYRRRGEKKRTFDRNTATIAADLLKAAERTTERWSYRILTTASFTGAPVSHTNFTKIMGAAEQGKLIERHRGHYQRFDFGDIMVGRGQATRFRALPGLFDLAAKHGLTPQNVDEHFAHKTSKEPRDPLILRRASTRLYGQKVKGGGIKYERTEQTTRLVKEVEEINAFLARHEIGGGVHRGYYRIFNQGDLPSFNWNKGGRLYSVGEDNYQTLKKAQRLRMTLNGERVVEIDIRASYLTLLHGLKKVPFDAAERDPYGIRGLPREVVKAWVTMTIGHTQFHKRWPTQIAQQRRDDARIDTRKHPLKELQPVILFYLPILQDWPDQPLTGFDLMYLESEAVIGTVLELMRDYRVPSLSVHDSIIVPATSEELASAVLKRRYRELSGITPHLEARKL